MFSDVFSSVEGIKREIIAPPLQKNRFQFPNVKMEYLVPEFWHDIEGKSEEIELRLKYRMKL